MSNDQRKIHLIGSLPFKDVDTALKNVLDTVEGKNLRYISDGEPPSEKLNRSFWILTVMQILAQNPNFDIKGLDVKPNKLEVARGEINMFTKRYFKEVNTFELVPKVAPEELEKSLHFGIAELFHESYPIFKRYKGESQDRAHLKYLVSVPSPTAILFCAMNEWNGLKYRPVFIRALAKEINEIASAHEDVIFQIELPCETALAVSPLAYMLPADYGLTGVFELTRQLSNKVSVGIHICVGDADNKAITKNNIERTVHFTSAIAYCWPSGSAKLEFIHLPLAEGCEPATHNEEAYAVFANLKTPDTVHVAIGYIHEKSSIDEMLVIHKACERASGRKLDVSSACGLGRRTEDVGLKILQDSKKVLTSL